MKESILQKNSKVCYVCGCGGRLHCHHVFGGTANRKNSDKDGLVIFLCPAHHNMSNNGVHFNKQLDLAIKQKAQKIWMKTYYNDLTEDEQIKKFIARYGKSWL